jgi:DNA repair protein RadC
MPTGGIFMADATELPRERLLAHGPQALTDAELLQLVVRAGNQHYPVKQIVSEVLATYPKLQGLAEGDQGLLEHIRGLGAAKRASILAGVELGRRAMQRQTVRYGQIKNSEQLGKTMISRFAGVNQESMLILFLDVKNQIITEQIAAIGTVDSAMADPRIVFREALKLSATNLIMVHNHPSGDPSPSQADRDTTTRFQLAAALLGMHLIDHLIVGGERYYSFARDDPEFN